MTPTQLFAACAGASIAAVSAADTVSTDQARAIVAEMLADAQTRSSLQATSDLAGHDGRFFLSSPGGDFRLNIGGMAQFRYMLNFGDELGQVDLDPGPPVDFLRNDLESGFQTARTRLNFGGTMHDTIDFFVNGEFNRDGGNFQILDAWTRFRINHESSIRVGQFILPFLYEELTSPGSQLAVDRSVANSVFNQGYSQGIEYRYMRDDWRLSVAFSDGFRSLNSEYTNNIGANGPLITDEFDVVFGAGWGGGESDLALTGRFEYKGAGDWSRFTDFTSESGSETAWMIGIAGHWESSKSDGFGTSDFDSWAYTVDANIKGDSWSLFGSFIGRVFDTDTDLVTASGNEVGTLSDFGVVVQGAVRLPESKWELFARWDAVYADNDYENSKDFNTLTFGTNYYMHGHAAKFTLDLQWFLDAIADTDAVLPNSGIGLLDDGVNKDQVSIRAQFQLLF